MSTMRRGRRWIQKKSKTIKSKIMLIKSKSAVVFRASQIGALMIGGNGATAKQIAYLDRLQQRKDEFLAAKSAYESRMEKYDRIISKMKVERGMMLLMDDGEEKEVRLIRNEGRQKSLEKSRKGEKIQARPLTEKMETDLAELIEKRDAPFELGETAKRYVEKVWLRDKYGYDEPVVTREMLKGLLCEQDSINLVSKVIPEKEFRRKNTERYQNGWVSGFMDVILKKIGIIEDVKSSWDLRTFFEVMSFPELYYGQAQSYMELTGIRKFRLHYCLVNTPEELILDMEKSFYFKFGCDEENKHYLECCEKIRRNHNFDRILPIDKVKTFEFEYDAEYVEELRKRAAAAADYYHTLKLNPFRYGEKKIEGAFVS